MTNNSLNVCYLDNDCNNHLTGHNDYFIKLDESISSKVTMRDDKLQSVLGKRTVL